MATDAHRYLGWYDTCQVCGHGIYRTRTGWRHRPANSHRPGAGDWRARMVAHPATPPEQVAR